MSAVGPGGEDRTPWLTWGLLVVCAVSLLYTQQLERRARAGSEAELQKAVAYLHEHPYLEVTRALEDAVDRATFAAIRDGHERARELRGAPTIAPTAPSPAGS